MKLQHTRTPAARAPLISRSLYSPLPHGCALRESGAVDPQVLVPPFLLAGKESGAVAAIDQQCARALGGNTRAPGQQWGRSIVWASSVVLPLMAAVWRLLLHGLEAWLGSLAINMAGSDAGASLGAMGADMQGRAL